MQHPNIDRLFDTAHQWGTPIPTFTRTTVATHSGTELQWTATIQLPDQPYRRTARTPDAAAWALLQYLSPPPDDQPA